MADVDTTPGTPAAGTPTTESAGTAAKAGTAEPAAATVTGLAGVRFRRLERAADGAALYTFDQLVFAFDPGETDGAVQLDGLEWGRLHGAVIDEGLLVGSYGTHSFTLGVPGGTVRAGGLTCVGVHPDHRRRGLLTAMMRAQLDEVAAQGECVSILYATEPAIYGRFGYGLASRSQRLTLPRRAALRPVDGVDGVRLRVVTADPDAHTDLVSDLHAAAWAGRPGAVPRTTPGLRRGCLDDPAWDRQGGERLRLMLATDTVTGAARGYALFRRKSQWSDGGPEGVVRVRELAALDPAANAALWGRLLDLDLMARVETDMRPLDDPLVHLLLDVRVARARVSDGLWLRIVDVPAALATRRYACSVDTVLEVRDAGLGANDGRWRLVGGPDGAVCERADGAAPDLVLDIRELGAAYLGGTSLLALLTAGLVEEARPGAAARVAGALSSPLEPFCSWDF